MIKKLIFPVVIVTLSGLHTISAQVSQPSPTPKISEIVSKNLEQITDNVPVSRENREQAYLKLLEGQRFIWTLSRPRTQTVLTNGARQAKQALQKAVELDPMLAEGYTALAELSKNTPPYDIDESILLANIAVKIDKDNFGGHQILAQLYTFKSQLNRGILDPVQSQKAIVEWKEIARLDPRNAEAYAFLSELYARTNNQSEGVAVLRKWVGAAAPISNGFYGRIFQNESLLPENASLKLGRALIKTKQTREAIEILSLLVADNPDNEEAVESLQQAVESADQNSAALAIEALQQAVYTNSENTSLVILLAQVQARAGKIDEAAKILQTTTGKLSEKDKTAAAYLQVVLGDIYAQKDRVDEAVKAFQNALTIRGITESEAVLDDERDFAIRVFDKMIEIYKRANRPNEARAVIERARIVLGKNDLFSDKKLISFYRETGKNTEALQTIRSLRAKNADDYALLRLEATTLTEMGKVDEAVNLVKPLIGKKNSAKMVTSPINNVGENILTVGSPMYDDFSNYLFISNLYTHAKRGKEAVEAVNQALTVAQGTERKEIAKLTLASVQQTTGDFHGAETTLRDILKQSPQNPVALNNLGYFLAERGEKLNEALDLIKKAVELNPNNPSYLDSLGWAYFKLGQLEEAETNLKNALRIDESSSTIQEHLGDVYQKQGKFEAAKTAWQKALNLALESEDANRLKTKLSSKNSK